MQRRDFIKYTGKITAASVILNGIPVKGIATPPPFTCQEVKDRVFVMINMFGANDTLNTVVPVNQYSIYSANRPTIKIPETGAGAYLNLDPSLPVARQTALHPAMTAMRALYDAGKVNIVHGVGYANNNRSHFKSDDLWNTSGDSTAPNFNFDSGWAGQLFEYRYPGLLGNPGGSMKDPPCIEMGSTSGSILFQTSTNKNASILLTSNNITSYYNTLIAVGGPGPVTFPASDYGNETKYIDDVQKLSNIYAERIQTVFGDGSNTAAVVYPNTNIANQLKTVARLIKGKSKTSMYTLHQYGFDTHGTQGSSTGTHANLLKDLSEAIKAFQDDIAALGFEDRVIITTHSEFSRTIDENAGAGTDHGGVSTMFVIGKGVKPGITGNPIDLTQVSSRGLTDLQYDYRRVWAAVLQDFMGHGINPMIAARMNGFTATKAPVIAATHVAATGCYIDQIILPVNLVTLNARLLPSGNGEVFWTTEGENNCKEYEVEYSTDLLNWSNIGTVRGAGTTSMPLHYTFEHAGLIIGKNYYRLWQIDLDGNKRKYGPATLQVKENSSLTVRSYPNPAVYDFNVTITVDKRQAAVIRFYDIQGHLLLNQSITLEAGFNKFNYPVSKFKNYKGELLIHITNERNVQRTIKQVLQ